MEENPGQFLPCSLTYLGNEAQCNKPLALTKLLVLIHGP